MSTETIKPSKQLTTKQTKILAAHEAHPEASARAIARELKCSNRYVTTILQEYGINYQSQKDYKENQSAILSGLQARLLSGISAQDIQKATLQQRIVSAGILFDKERELTGSDKSVLPLVIINRIQINNDSTRQSLNGEIIDVKDE